MPSDPKVRAEDVDLDAVTFEQALIDVEIANERVRDLTHRLVASTATVTDLRARLNEAERRIGELEELREEVEGTNAYRLARRIWMVRDALGI